MFQARLETRQHRENATMTQHKRFLAIDGSAAALWRFRGPVLKAVAQAGHEVFACAPKDTTLLEILAENPNDIYSRMGVRFFEVNMQRQGMNPIHELSTLIRLWQVIRNVHPDVVLSYSIKSSLYGSLAARLARVPHYYSSITGLGYLFVSESQKPSLFKRLLQRLLGIALAGNTRVFFQNPDDRDLFLRLGLLHNKGHSVIVNGSGVDLAYFAERPMPHGPTTFLMIARVQYHKGITEYIQAARTLKQNFPEAKFQLLGPFDEHPSAIPRAEFERLLRDGPVEFLGVTPDVRTRLANCHVYVLPSYREGTPLSTLEALATGRPVVTTDVPGCRETVVDGHNGFLVSARSADSLAKGMKRFLDDPALIPPMGKRSRQIAEDKYDVRNVVSTMLHAMDLL